jgi:UDP-glucose 4,6-dehydratase
MSWEEGLQTTVEWFKKYSNRFGNIEDALVAHPRIGVAPGTGVSNESGLKLGSS